MTWSLSTDVHKPHLHSSEPFVNQVHEITCKRKPANPEDRELLNVEEKFKLDMHNLGISNPWISLITVPS